MIIPKTILFIDDEAMLTELAAEYFEDVDLYDIVVMNDAAEALDFFKENSGSIDVVVCDLCLKNYSGAELLLEFHSINCDVLYFLSTGCLSGKKDYSELNNIIVDILYKPFGFEYLCNQLESVNYRSVANA